MKFYVTSDLHLDAYGIRRDFWNAFDPDAVLVVAGDISNSLAGFNYVEHVLFLMNAHHQRTFNTLKTLS